jgi:hypothetical protein
MPPLSKEMRKTDLKYHTTKRRLLFRVLTAQKLATLVLGTAAPCGLAVDTNISEIYREFQKLLCNFERASNKFFLWEFVEDKVLLPPSPANVDDLWARTTGAAAKDTPDKFGRTREEICYRWDICCATSGTHIGLQL